MPAADDAEEEAPREDILVVPTSLRRQRCSSLQVGRDQFEHHTDYVARMMHDMWEQVQDLREATGLPRFAPLMPRASSDRSPRELPCPPTSTNIPTSAGTAAQSSTTVEQLTPHTSATEEDPATTGEATPASVVVRPTTEDDTTVAAEVSSTALANVDEAARRPTPLIGATEDRSPMEEDPASTIKGDTTAPTEVSPSAFPDVDEAARRPMPLIGATEDCTPAEEDPASTAEGDTTAPSEVSPTAYADADEAVGQSMPLIGVTEDHAPTAKDPATIAEGAPTSVVVATTEGDTTATAEVSSIIVAGPDNPMAAVDLVALTIDDD
ncbi:hypothetical protein E2562_030524 [Oryza meyeriana var. granulata]|uniref:Uncharacterized protein n=1 Tax=Oryza meyeriana var. granulata TaxID=110450 RepID=A0A6G1BP75_9ORYZ|nr:hypothetical protein E2562_030524 [Oryza meyeriana var. granulata]